MVWLSGLFVGVIVGVIAGMVVATLCMFIIADEQTEEALGEIPKCQYPHVCRPDVHPPRQCKQ